MNNRYRQTLLASVVAALIAAPLWAAEDPTANPATQGTPSDPAPMQSAPMGTPSEDATAQAGTEVRIDHPLYAKSPEALYDQDVLGPDDQPLGRIAGIVSDRISGRIYAVISSGGFLGLGASKHALPLDTLQLQDGRIHLQATQDDLAAQEKYQEEAYVAVPDERPISEFSAFEALPQSQ